MKAIEFLKLSTEEMTSLLCEIRKKALNERGHRTPVYAVSKCANIIRKKVEAYLVWLDIDALDNPVSERLLNQIAPDGLDLENTNFEKAYQAVFPDALPTNHDRIQAEDEVFWEFGYGVLRESGKTWEWWLQLSEEDRVNFSGQIRKEVSEARYYRDSVYGQDRVIRAHPGYKRLVEFYSFAEGMFSFSFLLFLWSAVALTLYLLYLLQETFPGIVPLLWVITLLFAGFITDLWRDASYKASFIDPILSAVKEHRVDLDAAAKMNFFEFVGPWWRGDYRQ